jgi:hypothetical protein
MVQFILLARFRIFPGDHLARFLCDMSKTIRPKNTIEGKAHYGPGFFSLQWGCVMEL